MSNLDPKKVWSYNERVWANARIAELEAERDQAKAIVSRLRDFLFDYTQFHISTNPEERWWALVDKFDELTKELQLGGRPC